jgi:membrane protein DedA with SNARE-associated domain
LAVLLGRVTPVERSFVSIPAGVFELPLGAYTLLTLIGSAVWAFAFAAAGWGLGSGYASVHHAFRFADYIVVIAAAVAVAALALRRVRSRRAGRLERE